MDVSYNESTNSGQPNPEEVGLLGSSSYQKQDVAGGDGDGDVSGSCNSHDAKQRPRRNILEILQKSLSLDFDRSAGDGSEGDSLVDGSRYCVPHRRWMVLMALVLLVCVVVGVRLGSTSPHHETNDQLHQTTPGLKHKTTPSTFTTNSSHVDDQDGICGDPIMKLKSSAVLEGLQHGAVAADHPICSNVGATIMRDHGGNAIDAAVAVALCLGVANPASSGLGGGAFMLIHTDRSSNKDNSTLPPFHDARSPTASHPSKTGKITEVIDCREIAPAAATTDMYEGLPDSASVRGGLAIGVPGELRGLELAHARHGRLPWAKVVQPAIDLASQGVEVNANLAHEIAIEAKKYSRSGNRDLDYGLRALLTHGDDWSSPLVEGDILKNPSLAETLRAVQDRGSDAVYKGERAASLAKDIQDAGGIVTQEDLENYRATIRTPVVAHDLHGFSICGVPPPSSGGAAIVGAARFLSGYLSPLASFPDTLSVHRVVETLKHVFAIRMSLSDPDYNSEKVQEAVDDLVKGPYMEKLRQATHDDHTLPLSQYGGEKWAQLNDTEGSKVAEDAQEGDRRRLGHRGNSKFFSEVGDRAEEAVDSQRGERRLGGRRFGYLNDHGTSHFSIVDKDGNAVSMTTSVNSYFGSNVRSKSTGIILSNTMDDFSNKGRPNYFGLQPSEANYIEPGKKPLSSMSPTMVFRRYRQAGTGTLGNLMMVLGASGGPKIISAVFNVWANHVLLGMPLFESIIRPRVHDQLIYHGSAATTCEKSVLEQGPMINLSQRTRDALKRRGHELVDVNYEGTVQAIAVDQETGEITAACDVRKGGSPAGW